MYRVSDTMAAGYLGVGVWSRNIPTGHLWVNGGVLDSVVLADAACVVGR